MASPRSYTTAEKRKKAALVLKGARGAYGDTGRIEAQIDRINQRAEQRAVLELDALRTAEAQAERELAQAKAAERGAPRSERAAAKQAVKDARQALDRAARARRKR
jgi:hypothetical protein